MTVISLFCRARSPCAIRSETPSPRRREPVVTYAARTRRETLFLLAKVEREEACCCSRARGLRSDGFSKNFRPGPPAALRRKGGTLRLSPRKREREQHARNTNLCRSPARGAAVRAYTRARGQADRRAEHTSFYIKDHVLKRKSVCERNENDYPERWITWLVGR